MGCRRRYTRRVVAVVKKKSFDELYEVIRNLPDDIDVRRLWLPGLCEPGVLSQESCEGRRERGATTVEPNRPRC